MDLVLGNLGNQRCDGADDMGRLERAPHRQFASHLVERGDALAGLERRGVHALVGNQLLDHHFGAFEGRVGRAPVADLPGEDMVVVLAGPVRAVGLVLDVLPQHRRVRRHRLEWVDHHRQCFVGHFDEVDRVGRGLPRFGDDEGDFLVLEEDLLFREHGLHVSRERRHVMQRERFQILGRQHGEHAGDLHRLGDVDRPDPRMGVRRPHKIAIERPRQLEVVDVIALALDEADIFDPLALAAEALQLFGAFFRRRRDRVHSAASWNPAPLILAAAY